MAKILCIIIDGLRIEALECAHTRCINQLIEQGTSVSELYHQGPNLGFPALATMLTSSPPEEHGVLTDRAITGALPHPTSLIALTHYHNLDCSLLYSKGQINRLFPEKAMQTEVFLNAHGIKNMDPQLAEMAATHIQKEKPDLCFLYLQGTDIAGTHFGFMSEPYLEAIEQADRILEMLFEQIRLVGLQDDYITMVLATHSGSWAESRCNPADTPLPFIIKGPGINDNSRIERRISFIDLAPTLAHLLAIAPHPCWNGSIIEEILTSETKNSLAATDHRQGNLLHISDKRSAA